LEQKKGIWSWFRAKIRRFGDKYISSPSQKLGTARAKCGTAVPPPRISFCCFCFSYKLPISLFLTKKPVVSYGTV